MRSRATDTNEVHGDDHPGTAVLGAWSEGEDQALLDEYGRGCSLDELAGLHRRAVHDVRARLAGLGEAEPTAQGGTRG